MKKILLISVILSAVIFASCKKEREDVEIRYYINNFHAGELNSYGDNTVWTVNYYADGEMVKEVLSDSTSTWTAKTIGKPGDIAYMYIEFNEYVDEGNMTFSAGIQFEKQLFKEARRWHKYDNTDSTYSIKLAGTVPYVY